MNEPDTLVDAKLWRDLSLPEDQQWTLEWELLSSPPGGVPSVHHFATKNEALDKAKELGWLDIDRPGFGVRRDR